MAFNGPAKPVEIIYVDLVDGDTIRDRNGIDWLALDVEVTDSDQSVTFWLADTVTKVRAHRLSKPSGDIVTVMRQQSRVEEVETREAEVDAAEAKTAAPATEAEAEAAVEEALDGEVLATETADHERAREAAEATGEPMSLPPFAEFTDPEMRSHIFLVHGVYAHDLKTRKALVKLHDDLHADERAPHAPHDHRGEFPA